MNTLADHLRGLPDEALATLLRLRPDLVVPVPADLTGLAARAQSRVSLARALDGLDEFTLHILDAARLATEHAVTTEAAILDLVPTAAREAARAALGRLRDLALLYGPAQALRPAAGLAEVCPPYPAGLGRPAAELDPAVAALHADPAGLRRAVLAAPPGARAVLDRLAAGPPVGTVAPATLAGPVPGAAPGGDAPGPGDAPGSGEAPGGGHAGGPDGEGPVNPVRWLVARRLLVPVRPAGPPGGGAPLAGAPLAGAPGAGAGPRPDTVELPRELGLLLRRETGPLGPLRPQPPAVGAPPQDPAAADSAGAGQALEAVRQVEALLEAVAGDPPPLLRTGGLGVRELRRLARAAGLDDALAALLLETAYAARLVGAVDAPAGGRPERRPGGPGGPATLLPTTGYDAWRASPLARRWELLAAAWLALPRRPALAGQRDERDRPVGPLGPELERPVAAAHRRAVLDRLAALPPGSAPTPEEVQALLAWHQPRRAADRAPVTRETLAEAAQLGVSGRGALTAYGRALLAAADGASPEELDPLGVAAGGDAAPTGSVAARTLAALLPPPVDHVLVQADLTVVVPGPPEPALAAELEAVAVRESAGGATVYRLTPASVRRALDAGHSAEDLHGLFRRRSRTPLPQALGYLIDDAARRHGGLRAGPAGAYLRSKDEALLAEVLADRRLGALALRRLAPTVLVTPYPSGRLLGALRDAGYAPVAEDATGAAVLSRPRAARAPARGPVLGRVTEPLPAAGVSTPRLLGIVEQLRRGDAAARTARQAPATVRRAGGGRPDGPAGAQAHRQALAVLQQAVRERARVWVGYVDAHGATASRLVRPTSIGAGYLRAEDERTDTLHTFALHRITAAEFDEAD